MRTTLKILFFLAFPAIVSCFTTTTPFHHHHRAISNPTAFRIRGKSSCIALQFVADAEKEGVNRPGKSDKANDNDDNESWKNSWIPTHNGGYLPNLGRKAGRKKNVVQEVATLSDYKLHVAEEKEKLVVVRFYAPWCRACKAIASYYKQLPQMYPNVKFVEVPLNGDTETNMLHQGLGVPSLPFGHIYHPEAGLVEEQRISRKHFSNFRDKILQSYVDGSCTVQYDDDGTVNMQG